MANAPKRNPLRVVSDETRESIAVAVLSTPNPNAAAIAREHDVNPSTVDSTAQALDQVITTKRQEWIELHHQLGVRAYARVAAQIDKAPIRDATRVYAVASDKLVALMYPPAHTLVQTGQIVNVNVDPDTAQALKRMVELRDSVDSRNDAANTKGS